MPTATETIRVVDVVLDVRTGGSRAIYTYRLDGEADPGDAFFVPLGNRSVLGYAIAVRDVEPEALGFSVDQLKGVSGRVGGLSLPPMLMQVVEFVAEEYLAPLPVALSVATPPGVNDRLVTAWILEDKPHDDDALTTMQREVIATIKDSGGMLVQKKSKKLPAGMERALKLLRAKGILRQQLQLAPLMESRKPTALLRLSRDEAKVEDFLRNEGRKKPAQALTLMKLQEGDDPHLTAAEIKTLSGVTDSTIKALVEAGLLESVAEKQVAFKPPPPANRHQQLAIDAITDAVHEGAYRPFLLYGVTGSGKTEVYMRAASEALKMGKQVLYLVPEITLATQAISLLRERFGKSIAILHSELPPKERLESWMRIRNGDAPLVIGARSALFSPLTNLGLIVIDEEHESSYKQESSPRYHARKVAEFMAYRHKCPLVLGSATPSVESFYDAENGELELLSLPNRVAHAELPVVHIENLSEGYHAGRPGILTEELCNRIELSLMKGEQAILFLNRRAYSPFLICRDCGHQFMCPNCAVSLAFSRRDRKLRCHHCGFTTNPPEACPTCHGVRLNPMGIGTEKVEEAVREAFPSATVARLDRDIARKRGAVEEVLAGFRSREIQILVGTQMVAKGLDFPNVTLVGVILADISLNIPDFRASERTFQLLAQVSGRAGRGESPGHVVIQTFNPEHIAIVSARDHAVVPFYEAMRKEREEAGYPPFRRLVNVLLTSESHGSVIQASQNAARILSTVQDAEVLGPVDCPIERLQGRWRRHVLVKLPRDGEPSDIAARLHDFDPPKVQVTIDVDPYSMV